VPNPLPGQINAVQASATSGNDAGTRAAARGATALGLVPLLGGGIVTERVRARRRGLSAPLRSDHAA
jgi:hypothetical protein